MSLPYTEGCRWSMSSKERRNLPPAWEAWHCSGQQQWQRLNPWYRPLIGACGRVKAMFPSPGPCGEICTDFGLCLFSFLLSFWAERGSFGVFGLARNQWEKKPFLSAVSFVALGSLSRSLSLSLPFCLYLWINTSQSCTCHRVHWLWSYEVWELWLVLWGVG